MLVRPRLRGEGFGHLGLMAAGCKLQGAINSRYQVAAGYHKELTQPIVQHPLTWVMILSCLNLE